jgi:hypothetical protein
MTPNRPLYLADLDDYDETTGVFLISMVGKPAMGVEALALSRETEYQELKLSLNEDKMIFTGPVIIPENRVYRPDGTDTGRDIMFTAPQIERIRNKFHLKSGNLHLSNHNHVDTDIVNAHLVESWIIEDNLHDKAVKLGYKLPVGTWMASYQVNDRDYWENQIKPRKVTGFSLQGRFRFNKTNLAAIEPENPDNSDFWLGVAREFLAL